jgi:organic hydroperoxide reductase OsmC/OhrA
MIQYPIQFSTKATALCGMSTAWKVRSSDFEMEIAIPTEFEGPGGALSPEDLFAQALTNCFLATFKVLAEKSKVTFDGISVTGELTRGTRRS